MIDYYDACGYVAGFLFACGLIPQLHKSYQTKNLEDISYAWQFIFISAVILGIIYSVHKELPPVYISSSVELFFMIILLIMKIIYSKKRDEKIDDKDKDNLLP